jgi:hypothetical protein
MADPDAGYYFQFACLMKYFLDVDDKTREKMRQDEELKYDKTSKNYQTISSIDFNCLTF